MSHEAKLFISSEDNDSITRFHIFNWAWGYSPQLSSGCFHAGQSCLGPDKMVGPGHFLSSHRWWHCSLISEQLIGFISSSLSLSVKIGAIFQGLARDSFLQPSLILQAWFNLSPLLLGASLVWTVFWLLSSGSFTAVSNQFVWFSQLDWKAFGSRPCLLWDSMTQWLVCRELLHASDPEWKTHQTVS